MHIILYYIILYYIIGKMEGYESNMSLLDEEVQFSTSESPYDNVTKMA